VASENRDWGYDRIAGALANLGYEISDQTVGNVLRRHGLPPAPERKRTTTWAAFIRTLSLRKIVFGSGIGKPMIATGNSLSGEYRLGHGRDLVIKVGLWAASHSEGAVVVRNSPRHRNRRSCTATTRG
jgi:hypothetical protein